MSGSAIAASDIWGGGTSVNWGDAGNWSGGVPGANADVVINTGAGNNAPSNYNISQTFNSVIFDTGVPINNAGANTFGIASGGFITDNASGAVVFDSNTPVTLNGAATITVNSGSLAFGGGLTGTGPLSVANNAGAGALVFLGTSNYTGGTTVTAGQLQLGNGATNGTISGNVNLTTNTTGLVFDEASSASFGGVISGAGSVTQEGAGSVTLSGINTYTGGTNIKGGTVVVGASNNLGTGTIAFANNATLQITGSDTFAQAVTLGTGGGTIDTDGNIAQFAGIGGTGALTLNDSVGTGKLILTGTNNYSGGTIITAGALQIGSNTLPGTISSSANITDNGTLDLHNLGTTFEYGGQITGTGQVTIDGTNTAVVLTGTNTYSGGTTIAATDVLQIGLNTPASINYAGNIADNGTLDLHNIGSGTTTISGALTGTGTLEIGLGAPATVVLTSASNNFTGNTTIFSNSTLQIGTAGFASQLGGNITNQGALDFNNFGASATFGGYILGNGTVAVDNGTLILTNSLTNIGGTTTIGSGATLQVGNGANSPSLLSGAFTGTGTLTINSNNLVTLSGNLSNLSAFNQNGTGTTVLTGTNTSFTGTTTINGGTLQLGSGGTTGAIGSTSIVDGGALVFDLSNSVTYGGVISGSGTVTQNGGSALILTGTNTYTGATTIKSGAKLQIGTGGTAGAIYNNDAVTDNGTLIFDRSDGVSFGGAISGGGVVTQLGGGTLTLSGNNTYSGGTNIAAGILSVSSQSNLGTGAVNFTNTTANGATLQFNATPSGAYTAAAIVGTGGGTFDSDGHVVTWSGIISDSSGGPGSLTVTDSTAPNSGEVILTGNNTYTGGTTITSNGTLQIGNETAIGSVQGNITDNGFLDFALGGNTRFGGVISGSGAVSQNDTTGGTLTLSGTNTYTGPTTVIAGKLSIGSDANLGGGGTTNYLQLDPGTTLDVTATGIYAHNVLISSAANTNPSFNVADGTTVTWSGLIADGATPGTLVANGGGTLKLTNTGNTYSGGTIVAQATTLVIGVDGELGLQAGGVTLGDASTGGTLDVTSSFTLNNTRAVTLAAGGGTIQTESSVTFEIPTAITGAGGLTVGGTGTLVLAGTSSYAGGTTINSGGTLQLGDGTTAGLVAGNILDNGALIFNEAGNQTFSGIVSGTGSLTQDDTSGGTLTVLGAHTYAGGTTITAGALQLGNGVTAGSIVGNVTDNGSLAFNEPGSITFAGVISGSGGLTQNGPGALILTGSNTYTGTTHINSGILQLGNGGGGGSISANSTIVDNGTLVVDESGAVTIANAIGGSGNFAQSGTGTTILTGNNTYGGTTTINSGALQIGNGGTSGSVLSANITDNGTLAFDRSDTVSIAGVISGTGGLTQLGTGALILTGTNTYGGATTISAGALQIGNGGTTGSIASNTITDNGALVFDRSDTFVHGAVVSGSGSVTQAGTGTLVLTGANTYTGGTTISAGALQIGNGGTSGSLAGDITDNASLVFDRSDVLSYAGVISGTGVLAQSGPGTTILTGDDSYTGGTTISQGTLQLGNGGDTGSIVGNVTDDGALVVDRANSLTYSGVISGTGQFSQAGVGTTTLTGIETYTGPTTVSAGTLLVNGSIVSSSGTTVTGGGFIGGTGSTGKLTIGNNGTIMPGSGGLGTLTVNGTFLLGPGGTYEAEVNSTSTDLIKVNGTATLDGALVVMPSGTTLPTTPVEILQTTGGLSGTFSSVTVLGSSSIMPNVTYSGGDVFLSFAPTTSGLLPPSTADTNQSRVANAVNFALSHDNAIAFNPVVTETGTALNQTLSELSGETAVAFQDVAVSSVASFMDTLFDPSVGGRGGLAQGTEGLADNHPLQRLAFNGSNSDMPLQHSSLRAYTVWASFSGAQNTTDANLSLGTHRTSASQFGGTIGLDYRPKRGDGAIGIAFGATGNNWNLSQQLGKGSATAYQVGAYYSRRFFDNYITGGLSYARYVATTDRTVNIGGANVYHASFDSNSVAARAEFGHVFETDEGLVTPFARFQADEIGVPHYAETTLAGSPSFALSYTSKHHYDYTSEVGTAWNAIVGPATDVHARVGWLHDYAGGLSDTATFSAFQGASFTVDGASPPRDAAHVVLGIEHNVSNVALTLNAEAAAAGTSTSYGGTAAVSYRW